MPDLVPGHVHNSSQGALSALEHAEYVPKPRAEVVRRLRLCKSADPLVRQAWSFTRRLLSLSPHIRTAELRHCDRSGIPGCALARPSAQASANVNERRGDRVHKLGSSRPKAGPLNVLCSADLTGANLSRANARNAVFAGAKLVRADLRDADLTGADLTGAEWPSGMFPPDGWENSFISGLKREDRNPGSGTT